MSRATVLQLVDDLSVDVAYSATADQFYDDIVHELAMQAVFTRATLRPITAGTGAVTLPDSGIELLYAVYDDRILAKTTRRQLEMLSSHWRDHRGTPVAYNEELENDQTLRLYPVPEIGSKAFSFVFGEPLGRDFPEYSVTLVHTENEELPEWMDLPMALEILAREFSRESDHRDLEAAEACRQLATLTMFMALEE